MAVVIVGLTGLMADGLATEVADNATHDKPILTEKPKERELFPYAQLRLLPPLASLSGEGLRIVLDAYMNPYSYALVLGGKGDKVTGTLLVYSAQTPSLPAITKHFTVPRAEYDHLMAKFDELAVPYSGDHMLCLCGSYIAFERLRGGNIRSGAGNASCGNNYYKPIAKSLLPFIRKVAAPDLAIYDDWTSYPLEPPRSKGCGA